MIAGRRSGVVNDSLSHVGSYADNRPVAPADFYAQRSGELRVSAEESAMRYARYSRALVVLGLLACIAFYQSVPSKRWPIWTTFVFIPAAAVVVQKRHRCYLRSVQERSLIEYYEKGAARLAHKWEQLDSGDQFIDHGHFYSKDLDVFGHGSLYQLVCSARTQVGRATLAQWMQTPAKREEILERQEAIVELRARRDLPESIVKAGPMTPSDFRPEILKVWTAQSSPKFSTWAPILAFALAIGAVFLPILYWFGFLSANTLWLSTGTLLAIEMMVALIFRDRVKSVLEPLDTLSFEFQPMYELLKILEQEKFRSSKLNSLANHLCRDRRVASEEIRRLLQMIRLVKERENEWFAYISFCLLWGTQFAMAIERWRNRHGRQILEWMTTLGELEALISLSTYCYEHPHDSFPEVAETDSVFEAEGMGHPLLEETTCVRNDVRFGNSVRFLVVSGSNMSGKSTFLRSIGINAVLAFMGGPVCCQKLRLSSLTVCAAIRVQDSVVDGRSHFQAEMERLRRMIEVAGHEPLLFLADEIMGGTNSHDRRIAAEWVIQALLLRGAIGAITTHDLALTEIAANGLPGANVHFEDSGESGKLLFDYKLRDGVSTRSNALNIARMLGIDIAAQQR